MTKPDVTAIMKSLRVAMSKHSPEILTGIGIAGMIATTVMAVKATPKAIMLVNERECHEHIEQLPKKEVIKTCWKCYIPAAVTGVASITCLIGASSVNMKRNAALATAYTISETALREYKEKVVETIGEKKEQAVRDAVAKERVEKHHPAHSNEIIITGDGETVCFDLYTSRTFKSDIEKVKRAINELNSQMLDEGYVTLNDFYYALGLPNAYVGDLLGWNYNKDGLVKLNPSSQLDNGVPCLVVDFYTPPHYGYDQY